MDAKAYILIQAEAQADNSRLAELVARVPGVRRAEVVRGAYDVLAEVADDAGASLTRAALPEISEIAGVLHALPLRVVDATDSTVVDVTEAASAIAAGSAA